MAFSRSISPKVQNLELQNSFIDIIANNGLSITPGRLQLGEKLTLGISSINGFLITDGTITQSKLSSDLITTIKNLSTSSASTSGSITINAGTGLSGGGTVSLGGSTTLNISTPISPTLGGTGVTSPTAHAIPIAEGGSAFALVTLTNGQLLIGSTGADPVAAQLTAGAGISITSAAGAITIAATSLYPWTEVTGTGTTMAINNGYIANNAGLVTLTLPSTAAVGSIIRVSGKGAGGWTIVQVTGQIIHFGAVDSTSGVGGSVSSTNRYDQIELLCITANTDWIVCSCMGNITVV